MTITIFKDKDCKGPSMTVSGNIRDLKGMAADKPGSIRMTDVRDAIVLFKNDDWHGGACFLNGKQTVTDLGSAKEGGRMGFGNSVRSVRVTPFTLRLNVTVVTNGDELPGIWPSQIWADFVIKDIVNRVNIYLLAQNALIELEIARISYRNDPKQYDLSGTEAWSFPGDWKRSGEVDLIVVNRFGKDGKVGRTTMPCFGQTVVVAVRGDASDNSTLLVNEDIAAIMMHELGHYLGLGHGTADKDAGNIMFPTLTLGTQLSALALRNDQVREMQDRLANNLSRKGDRND